MTFRSKYLLTKTYGYLCRDWHKVEKLTACLVNVGRFKSSETFERKPFTKHSSVTNFKDKSKDPADLFGNYEDPLLKNNEYPEDPDDVEEYKNRLKSNRLRVHEYENLMRDHLKKADYKAAREVMMERMLNIDRAKPSRYLYNILINYCGKVGDLKDAFKLYNDMKKRGINANGATYTNLFCACASHKKSRYAIEVADKISSYLKVDTFHTVNMANYNAMLKAYGRHGVIKKCFQIMDSVLEERGKVRSDTYNFLLQSCISDKNSGFRHALLVWHKMLQNKTRPEIYTFNLLLRATRDCGFGDKELVSELVDNVIKEGDTRKLGPLTVPIHKLSKKKREEFKAGKKSNVVETNTLAINETKQEEDNTDVTVCNNKYISETYGKCENSDFPNLLSVKPTLGNMITISNIESAFDRLLLLGGPFVFLHTMENEFQVKPDIKTLTLLLDIIPNDLQVEEKFLSWMQEKKMAGEVTFFNMLMRRRCYRRDYSLAKDVLVMMQKNEIRPNLITFGVLAMTCETKEKAQDFIEDARSAGFRLNSEVLGTLLSTACHKRDYEYISAVLKVAKEEEVQLTPKFYAHLDRFVNVEKKLLHMNKDEFHELKNLSSV